ncbi:MAG: PDZ domain-containing protein [Candidatus Binatus sp.]
MGKNGGEPTDTILTLEEALKRFKRKRSEEVAESRVESAAGSNVLHADFSATVRIEGEQVAVGDLEAADDSASVSAQRDEANAGMPASDDLVAMIEGIPRTLEQLELLAAAEKAYAQDFPDDAQVDAEVEEDDSDAGEVDVMALAARHSMVRDYAFTAMGTALMVLVAFMVTRVPIVNERPNLVAQSIATPAPLKVSSLISTADLITNLVMVPDVDAQFASSGMPRLKTEELEARIKDTLKVRAFTDIGVSVSSMGDAYLAGEVYSLNEARKISQIVHRVNGVNQVHFLHPDVQPADRPAYFGVTTAFAPEVWGAKVRAVFIGSPADKAGIKPGDVISEFDGKTVPDGKTLDDIIAQYSPGQRVQFRVWHDGQPEYLVARMSELTTVASR